MKRCEIQMFLKGKGIYLSTGIISQRSLDFLLLFKQFHTGNTDALRVLFLRQKGMILHVDGTYQSGGMVVYVLQDDQSAIIVDTALIPSEAEEYIIPVLRGFKEKYGSPLVVVRDMAEGVASGISKVFPLVFQQICQIHFMRGFEKDLISNLHKTLKALIVKKRFTSKLKELYGDDHVVDDMKGLQRRWVHVIVDYLLYPLGGRVKWISRSLSYYVQYRRIQEVSALVRRIIVLNAGHNFMCREVMELDKVLRLVSQDPSIAHSGHILMRTVEWLDMLCDQLRITREDHLKDHPSEKRSFEDCKQSIQSKLCKIITEAQELGKRYEHIALKIKKGFERHWDELFIPDPYVDGEHIPFRRHNNGLESSHRRMRKSIRERTGRGETNREMEQYGDLITILSNLWNHTYQKEVLSNVNDLAVSLSMFVNDLPELRKEYRRVRTGPQIPFPDDKRIYVLQGFVEMLESGISYEELILPLKEILHVNNI